MKKINQKKQTKKNNPEKQTKNKKTTQANKQKKNKHIQRKPKTFSFIQNGNYPGMCNTMDYTGPYLSNMALLVFRIWASTGGPRASALLLSSVGHRQK